MKGFTLLEILIALTIMATLTVLSSQSLQQAIRSKTKLQAQIDEMSRVRDSLRVIERDINLTFHYRDLQKEFDAEVYKQKKAAPAAGAPGGTTGTLPQPPGSPGAVDDLAFLNDPKTKEKYQNRKDPTTQFVGKENSLDFATSNVARISEGELLADFAKVGYSLRGCKRMDQTGNSEQCLVRRLSPFVEGDITKGGEETVLLEDVSEFKLRFFGAGKQDWVSDWDTRSQDGATKDTFPQAVEISLTIEVAPPNDPKGKKKKVSMQLVAPLRFPNNKEKSDGSGNK
jgi:prepilin-type N-terminal cleavage/methylation domain-containing protein